MCEELSDLFTNKQVFLHEGGHYVPGKKHIYHDFLKNMSEKFVDKWSSLLNSCIFCTNIYNKKL